MIKRSMIVLAIILLLFVWVIIPAVAEGKGPSDCQDVIPGHHVSFIARDVGLSYHTNPGNAQSAISPYVPFIRGCNPNS